MRSVINRPEANLISEEHGHILEGLDGHLAVHFCLLNVLLL